MLEDLVGLNVGITNKSACRICQIQLTKLSKYSVVLRLTWAFQATKFADYSFIILN